MKFPIRAFLGLLSAFVASLAYAQQPVVAVRIINVDVSTGPGFIQSIDVTASGTLYTVAPTVQITGGGGTGAAAEAVISGGGVTRVIITNAGTGYTSEPTITFLGGGGTGATATARVAHPVERFPNPNEAYGPSGEFVTISALATGTFPAAGYTYTFYINGTPVGTSINNKGNPSVPGMISWTPPAPGAYFFSVTANDGTSPMVTSLPVRFFATGAVITSPQNPTLVPAGSSVVIKGDATTAQGFVRQIEFFVDGVSQGVDTTAPYSIIYTPSTPGAHYITAVATDNNGVMVSTPTPVVITTIPAIGSLPLVEIASPTNGSALRIPDYSNPNASIPVNIIASDSDGIISKIETYIDGVLVNTDQQFPYSFNWQPQAIGTYKIVSLAFDDKNNVVASNPSVVIVSAPPTVTITQPSDGATLPAGAPATVSANASDSDGSVLSVQFFADDVLIGDDTTAPYNVTWTPLATSEGKIVELTALATDNFGITRLSSIVNIRVTGSGSGTGSNIGEPPTVQLTSPLNNARMQVNQTYVLTAQASDSDGNIQAVQFFANGKSLGSDTTFPYSMNWTPVSLGNYAIQAKALDDKGNVTTSEVMVTVVANSVGLPTISLLSPLNGSRATVGSPVVLAAQAADSDGAIVSVDLLVDGEVVGTANSFPYAVYWVPSHPGTYTISAAATDDGGNRVSVSTSTVTVQAPVGNLPLAELYFNAPSMNATQAAGAAPSLTPVKVSYNSKLILGAVAVDEGGSIESIRFYLNGRLIDSVTAEPFYTTTVLDTLQDAILTAVVTDNSGNVTYTNPIAIDTIPSINTGALRVSLTSPKNGGTYSTGSQIVFAASHNAGENPVPQVDFYVNGQIYQTVASAPYTYTFGLPQPGTYHVHAVLRSGDRTTISGRSTITVVQGSAPTVSLTSPAHGSTVNLGVGLTLTANASDVDGLITSVQFYANGIPISSDETAPYAASFTPASEGVYRFTALATNSSNQTTMSSEVAVLAISPMSAASANPIYSGTYFAGTESGRITLIKTGEQSALAIAHSTTATGTPKVYYYQNLSVDGGNGISSAGFGMSGGFSDTGASGTFDNGRAMFIAPATFGTTSSVYPLGLYSGSITGRSGTTVVGIVGANGTIAIHLGEGTSQDAGTGVLNSSGAFSFSLVSGGRISGTLNPSTRFLNATVTGGPITGTIAAAAATGANYSDGVLSNLSARGLVDGGDKNLIAGFHVAGNTPKRVLIRAIGPSLAQYGVSGALGNPELQLYRGATPIQSNDNWGGGTAIASASAQVGAFTLANNSLDAVILTTLDPGLYTAMVSGVAGVTGVALVEVYDADAVDPFTPQKVLNLSSRGEVGTGDRIMVAGFVINGNSPKKVLVRAVGPTLASFGVNGTLADPELRIVQGTTVVRENDNWEVGNSPAIITDASARSGAFALPSGSKDAVILLSLAPGAYTAQVSGVNNTTGVAIVEVYEIQ